MLSAEAFPSFFGFFPVGDASLGDLVPGAGLVLVVEAIAEGRSDLFPRDRFRCLRVAVSVVSDKGRRRSFLEAGFLDREVDVGDDGGLDHLGLGVDIILDLGLNDFFEVAVSEGLLGHPSLADHYGAVGGKDQRAQRRRRRRR